MKSVTKLTTKGQIVLPKPLRERLRWRVGTMLDVEALTDGTLSLRPQRDDAIERAFGSLKEGDPLAALEAEHREELATDGRRRRRP